MEDICLAKNSPLTFSDNSESLATLNQSKKDLCYTDFIYNCKGKI